MNDQTPGLGHNRPPPEKELLENLKADNARLEAEYQALLKNEAMIPKVVTSDAESAKVTDYIKELTRAEKALDAARSNEVAPYLTGQRVVNNFFKGMMESLSKVKKRVDEPNQKYLKQKADAERRAREEKRAAEAEEAKRKLAEAQKAEADAKAAREAAEAEAARIKKEAEDAIAAKQKEIDDLKAKAEADEAAVKAKEKEAKEAAQAIAEKAEEKVREIKADARQASRGARRALDDAVHQDQIAAKAERAVNESDSVLSRTRAETGLAAVAKEFVGRIQDRNTLDLELLRPYIPTDALQTALNGYVRAGGRKCRGAAITEEIKTTYR